MNYLCDQDIEDHEQEKLIQSWLNQKGNPKFEYQHINSKGNPRNTLVRASFSLDQKIKENSTGTFSDLIAGCDGRDFECGRESFETSIDPRKIMRDYLLNMGFNEEEVLWLIKIMLLSIRQNKLPLEKYLIDSDW